MAKTGFMGMVIEGELKDKLVFLAKKERRTQTTIVEQALRNYFRVKRILKE
jgi:predicted transcriptional regulator